MAEEKNCAASELAEELDQTRFFLPSLSEDWGPSDSSNPLEGLPFAPFSKSDRVGKVSDWITSKYYGRKQRQFGAGTTSEFAYRHEIEESSFSLVDNTPRYKPKDGRPRFAKFSIHNRRRRGRGFHRWGQQNRRGRGGKRWGNRGWKRWNQPEPTRNPSVELREEWKLVETTELSALANQALMVHNKEDLMRVGYVNQYNGLFSRVTPKKAIALRSYPQRQYVCATTSEDPIMQSLIKQGKGTVYATDTILAYLMAAPRSHVSWDIIARKKDGVIILDKRPNSRLDFLTVNESARYEQEHKEEYNKPKTLSNEATTVNFHFSQQVIGSKSRMEFEHRSPFEVEGGEPGSVGYRYRRFQLSDDLSVVARCEVNAFTVLKGERHFLTVKALNEFDPKLQNGLNYREKLELQSTAVLHADMKNNNSKLTRWLAQALLAGTDELQIGFVSRVLPQDPSKHSILSCQRYKPAFFASALNMRQSQLWGALEGVLDTINAQSDGSYLVMKDPNNAKLNFYSIPEDAFDNEK